MIKNRYKDDYSRALKLNRRGRVVPDISYVGDYYVLPFDESQKKKCCWLNVLAAVLLFVIHLVEGMLNQDSSRTFWIVYPYLFVFLPVCYMFIGAVSFFGVPLRMQKAHYETSLLRIRHSCIGSMVLVGLSAILDVVYMVIHRSSVDFGKELLYFGFHALFLIAAFAYGKYYDRVYGGIVMEKSQNKLE